MTDHEPPPTGDIAPLAALDDPLRRSLYEFVGEQPEPVSRDDAAAHADIGRTLAAYHLDKLVDVGLLTADFQRPEGRSGPGAGRPAKLYSRADREFSVTLPPRDYELLARLMVEAVEEDPSGTVRAALGDVAERVGREAAAVARSSRDRRAGPVASLTTALRGCGYEPATAPDGDIVLRNCPFHRVARGHVETVCGLNLRLVQGLVDETAPEGACAALEPAPGRCCVVIHPG
jgi:predicted ArsR family transcriptional regulator